MDLFTSKQSRDLDTFSEGLGVSVKTLMANAGKKIAEMILDRAKPKEGAIVFLIGKGNNGGDGLVAAKILKSKKFEVVLIDSLESLKQNSSELKKANWIVDGLLGVGISGEVRGWYVEAIRTVNALEKKVLAIDIPSGLNADTGQPMGVAIRATVTACLGAVKLGCVVAPGFEFCGKVHNIDIGIPLKAYQKISPAFHLTQADLFKSHLRPRKKDSHKKDYGHVLVIAGSLEMPGAGFLASMAVLRAGAGVVTYALPKNAYEKFDSHCAEVMVAPLPEEGRVDAVLKLCEKKQAVVLGPGLGTDKKTAELVKKIIPQIKAPLVLDADGLNCLEGDFGILKKRSGETVLTPHLGEFAKLFSLTKEEAAHDRIRLILDGAKKSGTNIILKGYRSLIATTDHHLYVNPTGNPGMATAGMGDVLSGVIAGLIAQGIPASVAAVAAVFFHGLAGDMAKEELGEKGLISSDCLKFLPKTIKLIENITL